MITKIGLIGYGKMGKMIESLAPKYSSEVIWRAQRHNIAQLTPQEIRSADVIIEMTAPESALHNILLGLQHGVPVVCGTTGWTNDLPQAIAAAEQHGAGFLFASNFSVGVNLFFQLNRQLAALMAPHEQYAVSLQEIHHIHKKDAPSGTAITLAQDILPQYPQKQNWALAPAALPAQSIEIEAIREDEVPGTHTVFYTGAIDEIAITHRAFTREGFAVGALLAAKYMVGKQGFYEMKDVLGL